MCHPRIDGLFVATTAMVRYEQRILDTTVFALADRPGAGGFVGGKAGLAGPMVGVNPSSSHKARKLQRSSGARTHTIPIKDVLPLFSLVQVHSNPHARSPTQA